MLRSPITCHHPDPIMSWEAQLCAVSRWDRIRQAWQATWCGQRGGNWQRSWDLMVKLGM
jgi:hypothetical protein